MPRLRTGVVYVGIKGHVVALDRRSGAEVWRTPLKGSAARTSSFVTLHRDDDVLYAGVGGELFALDPRSGTLLWHNRLKGFGFGIVSVLGDTEGARSSPPPGAAEHRRQQEAAAAAAAAT